MNITHFETDAARTRALIADLDRIFQILNEAIVAEEELAGVSNRSQAGYPLHARKMAARRDNLKATIVALEQRLSAPR